MTYFLFFLNHRLRIRLLKIKQQGLRCAVKRMLTKKNIKFYLSGIIFDTFLFCFVRENVTFSLISYMTETGPLQPLACERKLKSI